MADVLHGLLQHHCQPAAALAIALQQVISHALRGFRTHPGQRAQGLDHLSDQARAAHAIQNGSFMPAGRLRPPARPASRSWVVLSTL